MLDTNAETRPDRRPAIVICAYDVDDPAWDAVEDLSGVPWSPEGVRTVTVPADDPVRLADILGEHLRTEDCRALLLIGRTDRDREFMVQMRAENRAPDGRARLSQTGPAVARVTVPVAEMVRAVQDAGLAAVASSEAEEDAGSSLLYSVLTGLADDRDAPAVGLIRVPSNLLSARASVGVKAAAAAIARHLSPLPRARGVA